MIPLNELTISTDEFNTPRLLAHWAWRLPRQLQPLFLSTFGDWFFQDTNGHVQMFDLVTGELKQIADTRSAFEAMLEFWFCIVAGTDYSGADARSIKGQTFRGWAFPLTDNSKGGPVMTREER
jgi:hypothetical protein